MLPRPLYYQRAVGCNIIVHEQADLHLVWDSRQIFLKPIPRCLLELNVWRDILRCNGVCKSVIRHKYNKLEGIPNQTKEEYTAKSSDSQSECEACQTRKLATGFLLAYTALVAYEHDLRVAHDHDLIPASMTWPQWRQWVKSFLASTSQNDKTVNCRYLYGELCLDRLNMIYRLTLRAPARGYFYGYNSYRSFWSMNTQRLALGFAYMIVVLTAMQVGLGTNRPQQSDEIQRASCGFAVFSILIPLGLIEFVGILFSGVFIFNFVATLEYKQRRMGLIVGRGSGNTA